MARESRLKLIENVAQADRRSFEHAYRTSYAQVYNYILRRMPNREAAEDVVAEAFLNAARFYHRFDPSRAKFSTWVISIARHCMSDYLEREADAVKLDDVPESTYAIESLHDELVGNQDLVLRMMTALDTDERELVFLKYYEGKRNVEIAEQLGLNPSTVSTRLSRALAKMRNAAS